MLLGNKIKKNLKYSSIFSAVKRKHKYFSGKVRIWVNIKLKLGIEIILTEKRL